MSWWDMKMHITGLPLVIMPQFLVWKWGNSALWWPLGERERQRDPLTATVKALLHLCHHPHCVSLFIHSRHRRLFIPHRRPAPRCLTGDCLSNISRQQWTRCLCTISPFFKPNVQKTGDCDPLCSSAPAAPQDAWTTPEGSRGGGGGGWRTNIRQWRSKAQKLLVRFTAITDSVWPCVSGELLCKLSTEDR